MENAARARSPSPPKAKLLNSSRDKGPPPTYPIDSSVYVKRSNGQEYLAVVMDYDAGKKIYTLELDSAGSGKIKQSREDGMRFASGPAPAVTPNSRQSGAGVGLLSGASSRGSSTGNVRNRILSERGATLNEQLELDPDAHAKKLAELEAEFKQDEQREVVTDKLKIKRKGVRPVNPEMEAFVAAIEAARERKPGGAPPTAAEIVAEQRRKELAATTTTPAPRRAAGWSIWTPLGSVEVASESLDAEYIQEDEEIARLEAVSAHPPEGLTHAVIRLNAQRLEALRERKTNRVPLRPTQSPHAVVLGEALLPLLPLTALPSSQVPSRFLIAS